MASTTTTTASASDVKSLLPLKSDAPTRDPDVAEALVVGLAPWNVAVARAVAEAPAPAGTVEAGGATRRVTVADELPLREDAARGAMDLVVVVVSLTSRLSFDRAKAVVRAVGPERLHLLGGRWALVVAHATRPADFAVPLEDVLAFAERYQFAVVHCDPDAPSSLQACGARLVHLLAVGSRRFGVSPLIGWCADTLVKRPPPPA